MYFEFNLYSSLLLPAFFHGLLFSILFFYRAYKEDRLSDSLMGWLIVINTLRIAYWMLGFAGWYDTHDAYTSFMFYFPFQNLPWAGPLLYFYFLSVTNAQFKFQKKHLPHFIVPVAWTMMIVVKFVVDFTFYTPFEVVEANQYGTKGPWADLDKKPVADILGYLSFFYYAWLTIKAFKAYQIYIRENFSSTEDIDFSWIKRLLYGIVAGVFIFLIFMALSYFRKNGNTYAFYWHAFFGLGLIVYYLSIAGYFQRPKIMGQLHFTDEALAASKVLPNKEFPELDTWKARLLDFMTTHQPYLQADLSLSELARMLKTNPGVLSRVINEGSGQNFNDFVNDYRVKEVILKMNEGKQAIQTLLGIAYDCGFNSKATFNRAFKKTTGQTPKDYIDGLKT